MLGTDAMMEQSDSSNLGNPSKEKAASFRQRHSRSFTDAVRLLLRLK
jgi:hypothetical protein